MDFWGGFLQCVLDSGVQPDHARWYVNWANRFARAIHGVPLRNRSIEDISRFLEDLKAAEDVAPWQREQARLALRLLYKNYLKIDPASMPRNRADTLRDGLTRPNELAQLHGDLLARLKSAILSRHYSPRTCEAYIGWTKRFIAFHDMKAPDELDADHIKSYLDYLATERRVASSTQNQALNAIVFLYTNVLSRDPGDFSDFTRAKMPIHTPAALSVQQIEALLKALQEPYRMMALLMYGGGLRIMECLHLRVGDLGFDQGTIRVVAGKGAKDRTTVLPQCAIEPLKVHLADLRVLYEEERLHDPDLPWHSQLLFPSRELRVDAVTRRVSRSHINHNSVQKALQITAARIGIPQKVTPHSLRHAFASHLFEQGCHILTIQELLGHARQSTTMIYTHPMNRPGKHPQSPLDIHADKLHAEL